RHGAAPATTAQHGESTADEHLSIRLQCHRVDGVVRAGIQIRVEGSGGSQSAKMIARRRAGGAAAERRKGSADEDLSIRLHRQDGDWVVRAGTEWDIERTVGVEPPAVIALGGAAPAAAQQEEVSADQDLSVRLYYERQDDIIGARIEPGVEGAVGIEAPDKA